MPHPRDDLAVPRNRARSVIRGIAFSVAVVLGIIAVWLIVTGTTQKRVEVGVLAGLWGLLLAGYAVSGTRHPNRVIVAPAPEPGQGLDVRTGGALETRESAAARRAYEYRLEEMLRRQIQAAMAAEMATLRSEVAALRSEFEKSGGQLRLERIETTRLIGSSFEDLQRQANGARPNPELEAFSTPTITGYTDPAERWDAPTGAPARPIVDVPQAPAFPAAPVEPVEPFAGRPEPEPWLPAAAAPSAPPPSAPSAPPAPPAPPAPLPERPAAPAAVPSVPIGTPWKPWEASPARNNAPEPAPAPRPLPQAAPPAPAPARPAPQPAPTAPPASVPLAPAAALKPQPEPQPEPQPSTHLSGPVPLIPPVPTLQSEPYVPLSPPAPTPSAPVWPPARNDDPFADMPRLTRFVDSGPLPSEVRAPSSSQSNGSSTGSGYGGNGWAPAPPVAAPEPTAFRPPAPVEPVGGRRRRDAGDSNDVLSRILAREGSNGA